MTPSTAASPPLRRRPASPSTSPTAATTRPSTNIWPALPPAAKCRMTWSPPTPSMRRRSSPSWPRSTHSWPAAELEDFTPQLLDLARIHGQLFSLPRNVDVRLLHYRTDLIAQPPATWDELLDLARALNQPPHQYGFVFPGMESGLFGTFYELVEMGGAELFPPDLVPADRERRRPLGAFSPAHLLRRGPRAARDRRVALRQGARLLPRRPCRHGGRLARLLCRLLRPASLRRARPLCPRPLSRGPAGQVAGLRRQPHLCPDASRACSRPRRWRCSAS